MKNRKFWVLLWFLLIVSMSLSACGKTVGVTKNIDTTSVEESVSETEAEAAKEKVVFSTGKVQVTVPEGWLVVGANKSMDGYEDKAADVNSIYLCKGAKSAMEVFDFPGIQVNYYDPNNVMLGTTKDFYENAKDIEAMTLDNYTWSGFSAESVGAPLVLLLANPEEGDKDQFQVAVWLEMGGKKMAMEDADVLEIISSLQPTK